MRFEYKLTGIGWAQMEIEIDGKVYYSFPSYLSEPLVDLLEGLLTIIPTCVPDDELKKQVSFKLYQEPSIDKLTLKLTKELELQIIVEEFKDNFDEKGKVEFNMTCYLLDFLKEVIKSLDNLLKTHGFVGYKNTWYRQDFPIASFLKLKYYLNKQQAYPTLKGENELESDLEKSDLEKEIKLIYNS